MSKLASPTDESVISGARGVQPVAPPRGLETPANAPAYNADSRLLYRVINLRLALSDVLCIIAALALTQLIRFGEAPLNLEDGIVFLEAPIIWLAVFHAFGLHAPQRLSAPEEFRRVLSATCIGVVAVMAGTFWSEALFSREWIGWTLTFALSFEMGTRYVWRSYARRMKSDGRLALRTLIVGTADDADQLTDKLLEPGSGFSPIGFINPSDPLITEELPWGQRAERLRETIRAHRAECIFIASGAVGNQQTMSLAQVARMEGVELRLFSHLPGILSSRLTLQSVGTGGIAMALHPVRLSETQRVAKRIFDLIVSLVGVIILTPLFLVLALAIKFTSAGPVFFRQRRVTKGGHEFSIYKFRTMRMDGGNLLTELALDPAAPFFKIKDDPRLTGVGRILRNLSIDELPQLINVILGEMSLVGPRPLPAEQVAANLEVLESRHEVRAGVTGWWQIHGRSDVTVEDALRMDLFYIENWSLMLDLYILARTAWVLITRKGAY